MNISGCSNFNSGSYSGLYVVKIKETPHTPEFPKLVILKEIQTLSPERVKKLQASDASFHVVLIEVVNGKHVIRANQEVAQIGAAHFKIQRREGDVKQEKLVSIDDLTVETLSDAEYQLLHQEAKSHVLKSEDEKGEKKESEKRNSLENKGHFSLQNQGHKTSAKSLSGQSKEGSANNRGNSEGSQERLEQNAREEEKVLERREQEKDKKYLKRLHQYVRDQIKKDEIEKQLGLPPSIEKVI
jgi:hypothetical protein